nr:putative leucine-rich repeat-containing protein [Tanacetum cinerariifolium]
MLKQSDSENTKLKEYVSLTKEKLEQKEKKQEDLNVNLKNLQDELREAEERYGLQITTLQEELQAQEIPIYGDNGFRTTNIFKLVEAYMLKKPKLKDDYSAIGDQWNKRMKKRVELLWVVLFNLYCRHGSWMMCLKTHIFLIFSYHHKVGEGSGTPTEPHHTPSPEAQLSPHNAPSSPSQPPATTKIILTSTPTEIPTLRENINKSSALPHDSTPRVTSLDADDGTQDLEISSLKARIKLLEDKDRGSVELSGDDAPIKGRTANVLTSGVAAVSVPPVAGVLIVGVPTVSGLVPTVSAIFTIAIVVTPYSRRPREISVKDKGKEKVDTFWGCYKIALGSVMINI